VLVLGTSNEHKVAEFTRVLKGISIASLAEVNCHLDVAETGATYRDNAILKARAFSKATGAWVLSDDTGLEVDALNGAPGVFSARYAGQQATGSENVQKLLLDMKDVVDRRATFHCALALANPQGEVVLESSGVLPGTILESPVGEGGFTYDFVFFEQKSGCTLAEMPGFAVDQLSHRAVAVKAILPQMQTLLS